VRTISSEQDNPGLGTPESQQQEYIVTRVAPVRLMAANTATATATATAALCDEMLEAMGQGQHTGKRHYSRQGLQAMIDGDTATLNSLSLDDVKKILRHLSVVYAAVVPKISLQQNKAALLQLLATVLLLVREEIQTNHPTHQTQQAPQSLRATVSTPAPVAAASASTISIQQQPSSSGLVRAKSAPANQGAAATPVAPAASAAKALHSASGGGTSSATKSTNPGAGSLPDPKRHKQNPNDAPRGNRNGHGSGHGHGHGDGKGTASYSGSKGHNGSNKISNHNNSNKRLVPKGAPMQKNQSGVFGSGSDWADEFASGVLYSNDDDDDDDDDFEDEEADTRRLSVHHGAVGVVGVVGAVGAVGAGPAVAGATTAVATTTQLMSDMRTVLNSPHKWSLYQTLRGMDGVKTDEILREIQSLSAEEAAAVSADEILMNIVCKREVRGLVLDVLLSWTPLW
jgi:hypothetical protein